MDMWGVPGEKGTTTIGDLEVKINFKAPRGKYGTSGGDRNPLEEINALRSLCDRTSAAKSDAVWIVKRYRTHSVRFWVI